MTVGTPCSTCLENEVECYTVPRKPRIQRQSATVNKNTTSQFQEFSEQPGYLDEVLLQHNGLSTGQQHSPAQEVSSGILESMATEDDDRRSPSHHPESLEQHSALHSIPHYPFLDNLFASSVQDQAQLAQVLIQIERESGNEVLKNAKGFGQEELRYLERIGAFQLPQQDILHDFIRAYFEIFHPFFPIVDKARILSTIGAPADSSGASKTGTSLLLLHALLLVASAVSHCQL